MFTQSQGLFCSAPHARVQAGRGDMAGTADPGWPKWHSTPYDITLSIESWGKEEEGRGTCLEWCCLSSRVTITRDGALLSWRWLNRACWREAVNEFLVWLCLHEWLLLYLLNYLYLNPRVFSLLPFQFSPHPSRGKRASGCLVLSCQLGWSHDSRWFGRTFWRMSRIFLKQETRSTRSNSDDQSETSPASSLVAGTDSSSHIVRWQNNYWKILFA